MSRLPLRRGELAEVGGRWVEVPADGRGVAELLPEQERMCAELAASGWAVNGEAVEALLERLRMRAELTVELAELEGEIRELRAGLGLAVGGS